MGAESLTSAVSRSRSANRWLENYTFLTPCVEIKKANLYRGFHESILGRFSNAAVDSKVDTSIESPLPRKQKVTWSTNGHRGNRLLQQNNTNGTQEALSCGIGLGPR